MNTRMKSLPSLLCVILISATSGYSQLPKWWPPKVPKIDRKPILLKKSDPFYPDSALRNGITGDVYVHVTVEADGTPGRATIAVTDDSLLNQSALAAVKGFLFSPAMSDDEPVSDRVTLLFSYKQIFDDACQFHLAAVSMDDLNQEIVEREHPPQAIRKVTPRYPRIAWEARLDGKVILRMHVTVGGTVDSIDIISSDSRLFTEACVEAAKGFLFEPSLIGKKRIPVWVVMPFQFKSEKGIIVDN
jgi:TonB family protein